ncbi:hypothetical protein [Salidesulfovibrio onnuriiensis]|uniref:hypothetical protein n=1 Tax=Salidesulfovibrio onnuriiensis TaxID=2583823 RepID=UPI0011CAA2BB|nr:hypothetical protein [Salidesulfovibrio onnuriiensis]
MRRFLLILFAAVFLSSSALAGPKAPVSLAGITLGEDYHKYEDLLRMELAGANSDAIFLDEALIRTGAIPGVRGGSVIWGNCANKDRIVRLKIKFADTSEDLFKRLLERYREKFGQPSAYQGDSFRNVVAWEWDISDAARHVNIVLMYSVNPDIRPGVSIKLTDQALLDLEFACYKENYRSRYLQEQAGAIEDLDTFVPR